MTFISPKYLPPSAHHAIDLLHQAGFEAFVVGGWIRDHLLERATNDLDLATNASPSQMLKIFRNFRTSEIGARHGTVGVYIEDQWIEITTYRSEQLSYDARHPSQVDFVSSLKEDIIRRDFTINALVMDHQGNILDWVSGLDDLSHQRIRCVGEPEKRFTEDALRMLRAIRFMCKLNFKLDLETRIAMSSMKSLLGGLAQERILAELVDILEAPHAALAFSQCGDVMAVLLPELNPETIPNLDVINTLNDFEVVWVYLYAHQAFNVMDQRLVALKTSNHTRSTVQQLHHLIHAPLERDDQLKRALGQYGEQRLQQCFQLKSALNHSYPRLEWEAKVHRWIKNQDCLGLKDLDLKGHDVMALGLQGRTIQAALEAALDAVLTEQVSNTKAELIAYLKSLKLDS